MILLAFLLQAATPPVPPPVLGAIGKQELPARGCAAYLWSASDRALVAMAVSGAVSGAGADPARLRVSIDGRTLDVDRSAQSGEGGFGFAGETVYAGSGISATLAITIEPRTDVSAGAAVPAGTLSIARDGGDMIVVPVAGLIGCA